MHILRNFPGLRGEFILQDRPDVIEKGKENLGKQVKTMPHDFFTEQVVKGTFFQRSYSQNTVLHTHNFARGASIPSADDIP